MINRQDVEETLSLILKRIALDLLQTSSRADNRHTHTFSYSLSRIENLLNKYLLMRMRKHQKQAYEECLFACLEGMLTHTHIELK